MSTCPQVSPACSIRVSLLQLLQQAGAEAQAAQHTAQAGGARVRFAAVPGRQHWYSLAAELPGAAGAPAGEAGEAAAAQLGGARLGQQSGGPAQ